MKIDHKSILQSRKSRNQELIRRMRNGEPLKAFDSNQSWFPPRPTIKKDKKAIEKLYGDSSAFGTLKSLPQNSLEILKLHNQNESPL